MALYFPLVASLMYCHICLSLQAETLNECERGVKRHHPSQANVYQVFARRSLLKQWIDYECEKYMIFDPRKCACVEREYENKQPPRILSHSKYDNNKWQGSQDRGSRRTRQRKEVPVHVEKKIKQNTGNNQGASSKKKTDSSQKGSEPDCHLHQASTESESQFERWTDGRWVTEDCNFPFYTGLIWNQDSCRCEWGTNRTSPIAMQENVVPASCLMMLQMSFDDGDIKDEGRGIWVNVHKKDDASAVRDSTAVGGYSGSFRGASMTIPFFKSNIIGPIFHVGFQFKLCPGTPDTDIFLLHNDCPESLGGPGLVLSYQAWKKQVIIAMRTQESELPIQEYCTMKNPGPQKSWVKLDIRYQDNYLEVRANDEVCATSSKFYGPMATNNCPLTLLGPSFCGNLDEVIITRGCTDEHAVS